MRKHVLAALALLACPLAAHAQKGRAVTARQVNGTYRDRGGSEFKILALGAGRLRVEFNGVYSYRSPAGGMTANTGTASGEARIEGDVAEFVPEGTEGCRITLRFLPRRLVVTQRGADHECGFGHNVSAGGTYTRRSGARPKFGERE